jgi:hypothetical protein
MLNVFLLAVMTAPPVAVTPTPPRAPAHVLLLGTFHFDDAGLDSYKPEHRLDVFSKERQREIQEVVDCLAQFRPTKVAVEGRLANAERLNERYRAYVAGTGELRADEIDQIGFRLARRMGHAAVHPIDAKGRGYGDVDLETYAKDHGQLERLQASEKPWSDYYEALWRAQDVDKTARTLRQSLVETNDPERVRHGHGSYLIGAFKVGEGDDYPGVDAKTAWYNRNLRIFANIQRITSSPEERILVLIGAGHLPILRHAVESSPEYRLIETADVLRDSCAASAP